ncbi:uncharacterized protein LOC118645383 [Monomorium pharaonis]|uniref:uncharacterized protein LOC118645383 n=1 Tax=Monomorium pharaonis TaxID=307658 RepID=UPI0017472739|nr:uncharacterized protein LOC118645383 [Monomorium pharaonis]
MKAELLDSTTRLEWETRSEESVDPPDFESLMSFISKRILSLNAARPKSARAPADSTKAAKSHFAKRTSDGSQCVLCKGRHNVMMCIQFKSKSANKRKAVAETHRLCFNCLGSHSAAKCPSSKTCLTCRARHHSMLHAYVPSQATEVATMSATRGDGDRRAILLATARVDVTDHRGDPHTVRALIDQRSEVSLISESLVQQLHLPRSRSSVCIFGIGSSRSGACRGRVKLTLTSKVSGEKINVVAFILPRLSIYQGSAVQRKVDWPHLRGLQLADPDFLANDAIKLLLGAEVCSIILREGLRRRDAASPIAQCTLLGWILSGNCEGSRLASNRSSLQCTVDRDLFELVQWFWAQERESAPREIFTPDEQLCESVFVQSHKRTSVGRYIVRLPFSSLPTSLGETRRPAERLLASMERRCDADAQFGSLYRTFLKEYEKLQHMEPTTEHADVTKQNLCYLPHHGVLRDTSASTKLRVVFNGFQRTKSGESLNSHLLVGANLLPPLADVLLRWRWHRYVMAMDEKMYRQILVAPENRDFQRILWRHSPSDSIREYRLNTVTYGLACVPFLAIRTLRQLADDEETRFPRGAAVLRRDCYVDDIVTGAHSKQDGVAVQKELRQLCTVGGFPLRKWSSNCPDILVGIPSNHCLLADSVSWKHEGHATLGLHWYPAEDAFSFSIKQHSISNYTKRSVLAETARLFDPLGWLAPVVIRAKILIQSTWLQNLERDAPLHPGDVQQWQQFFQELPQLASIRVGRWAVTKTQDSNCMASSMRRSEAMQPSLTSLLLSCGLTPRSHLIGYKATLLGGKLTWPTEFHASRSSFQKPPGATFQAETTQLTAHPEESRLVNSSSTHSGGPALAGSARTERSGHHPLGSPLPPRSSSAKPRRTSPVSRKSPNSTP